MTIPAHTSRVHLKPYWLGDSPRALNVAATRRAPHNRCADVNFQLCADDEAALHWGTARQNDYRYVKVGKGIRGRRRPMTREELNRLIQLWRMEDIRRWRQTPRYGPRFKQRVRPYSFLEMARMAKRRRVYICAELKSRGFANEDVAVRMVNKGKTVGWPVYYMTLVTMKDWGGKMRAFHNAGGETALLAHGAKRPSNLSGYMNYIDRIWGRFR